MPIELLPVFEADADPARRDARTDEEIYNALEVPDTLVVKFGYMKLVAEFKYVGDVKPGCGTKLVARTHRGTELVEMLTTTCENAGCSKSVTRQEMLEFIENSGGKDFPFHTNGRILRVATIEDLNRASGLESSKREWVRSVKAAVAERKLEMKVVEVEPILGEEVLTVYYMAEDRIDFRDLVRDLAAEFATRIEMRQVGARDEARLVADYERCGQHCCCRNFLKVLKPISMRAAKMQKATLDPLKISGRCGRLMCCLRYEDQTYRDLKKNLPHRKTRVGTVFGPGLVMDSKILAQLVLVKLEHNNEDIAVPIEELMDPETCPKPGEHQARLDAQAAAQDDALRGLSEKEVRERTDDARRKRGRGGKSRRRGRSRQQQQDAHRKKSQEKEGETTKAKGQPAKEGGGGQPKAASDQSRKRKRRRRRGRGKGKGGGKGGGGKSGGPNDGAGP